MILAVSKEFYTYEKRYDRRAGMVLHPALFPAYHGANLLQVLYNLADSVIVGNLISA